MKRLGPIRLFALLLAIAAMVGVATASSSAAHFHAKPPANGCDVCFAAHVTSLEAKPVAVIADTPLLHGRLTLCPPFSGYQLFRSPASLTRGPPSLSLS